MQSPFQIYLGMWNQNLMDGSMSASTAPRKAGEIHLAMHQKDILGAEDVVSCAVEVAFLN
jgi:hypothetical protein